MRAGWPCGITLIARSAKSNCQDLWIKIFPWWLSGCAAMKSSIRVMVLAVLGPIAAVYVAGSLDDARQRELLVAKLDQIEDKRRQLGQMSEFLRAKLEDLGETHQDE
jgi:hypothetical protein